MITPTRTEGKGDVRFDALHETGTLNHAEAFKPLDWGTQIDRLFQLPPPLLPYGRNRFSFSVTEHCLVVGPRLPMPLPFVRQVLAPLTEVSPATRETLKAAVLQVDSAGGTDILHALQAAEVQLAKTNSTNPKAVVLLTDGVTNRDISEFDATLRSFATNNWRVHCIGLSLSDAKLAEIADRTGGQVAAHSERSSPPVQGLY